MTKGIQIYKNWIFRRYPFYKCDCTQGNRSYLGSIAYSYDEPIGILLGGKNNFCDWLQTGKPAAIVSTVKISSTTTKHQNELKSLVDNQSLIVTPLSLKHFADCSYKRAYTEFKDFEIKKHFKEIIKTTSEDNIRKFAKAFNLEIPAVKLENIKSIYAKDIEVPSLLV